MPTSGASGTRGEQLPGLLAYRLPRVNYRLGVISLIRMIPEHFIGASFRKGASRLRQKERPHPSDCKGGALFPPEQLHYAASSPAAWVKSAELQMPSPSRPRHPMPATKTVPRKAKRCGRACEVSYPLKRRRHARCVCEFFVFLRQRQTSPQTG